MLSEHLHRCVHSPDPTTEIDDDIPTPRCRWFYDRRTVGVIAAIVRVLRALFKTLKICVIHHEDVRRISAEIDTDDALLARRHFVMQKIHGSAVPSFPVSITRAPADGMSRARMRAITSDTSLWNRHHRIVKIIPAAMLTVVRITTTVNL